MANPHKIFPNRNAQCRDWRQRRRYQGLCIQCGRRAARNWHGHLMARCRRHLDRVNLLRANRRAQEVTA